MYNLVDELTVKIRFVGMYKEGIKEYRTYDGATFLWVTDLNLMENKDYFHVHTRLGEYLGDGEVYGDSKFIMIDPKELK